MLSYIVLPLVWVAVACMSCGTAKDDEPQVTEACAVLRTADSLRAQGVLIDDSIALARAVTALGSHQRSHADDYVRACYYYGRLLRKRNNYTAAMQTFINAIHTETTRHDIKGRVYSNMGSMCHLANEPDLASEMYSLASEQFMTARDTTAYYYALNDMAFELAEQKRKGETLAILGHIENQCTDSNVIHWLSITKDTMYLHCEQYDSALFHANRALSYFPNEHTCMLAKAQSFSLLGIKDSAVVYAGQVMDLSSSMKEKYNALYVLAYDNPDISYDEMCELTQLRADIGALLENQSTNLTSAIIQIKQDKDNRHKFHVLVLWAFAALMALLILFTVMRRHIIRKNIVTYNLFKRQNKIIAKTNNVLAEQNEQLKQQQIIHNEAQMRQLEKNCELLRQSDNILKDMDWHDYDRFCEIANRNFFMIANKLKAKNVLCEKEIRFCILVMTGCFNSRQIASLICYAESGIRNYKQHIAKKLGIKSKDLRTYLLSLAVGQPYFDAGDENIHTTKKQTADL